MSKYIHSKLNPILALSILMLFAMSCKKTVEPVSTEVQILSFGPTGIQHGETMVIIGRNLLDVNAVVFTPGLEINSADFESQTDDLIEVIVPMAAEKGKIKLITADGEIESKTEIDFEVLFSITDITAEARPEDNITIRGEFLNWIESVTFFKGNVVDSFVSQSDTEIVLTVPKEAKTGPLIIAGRGTEPVFFETETDFIVTLPVVTGMTPLSIRHTDVLTISGTNLDLTREIVFPDGSVVSDFEKITESSIEVKVPATSLDGTLTLVVHSLEEIVTAEAISIILPSITELNPTPVPAGSELTITGANLDLVQSIAFPGVPDLVSDFNNQAPTEIKVTVPDSAISGLMKFTTIHGFVVNTDIELKLPGGGPTPLTYTFFGDNFENGWQDWSWGGTVEAPSNEVVFNGTAAIKKTYDGSWDGFSFGGSSVNVSSYTNMVVYVYGGTGTGGQVVQMVLNEIWGSPVGIMTVTEGQWTEFSFPVSDLVTNSGAGYDWTRIIFQGQGNTGDIYFDFVGFR
ncbi:MAG: hypothetical protein KDD63_02355 [Bacteroidetes bacterium]|nr:hypothetical protein [Bacteroidota bacterium]MCB0851058.1 hypothetical protein [Bacteroidota bacterium]